MKAKKNLANPNPIPLKWLDTDPPTSLLSTSSFGVPWAQGQIDKTTPLRVVDSGGNGVPVQTRVLAFWPDASVKWTGHILPPSTVSPSKSFSLAPGTPQEPKVPVSTTDDGKNITVTSGGFVVKIPKSGSVLVSSATSSFTPAASHASSVSASSMALKALLTTSPSTGSVPTDPNDPLTIPAPVTAFNGITESAIVESSGPTVAVVKVQGHYHPASSSSSHAPFLPFIARLYIGSGGNPSIKLNHFFIYDGDQNVDFIKGLGVSLTTPLTDSLQDRHVRFVTTDGGLWAEPVRVLSGLRRDPGAAVTSAQFEGKPTGDQTKFPSPFPTEIDQLPTWADFNLVQSSSERFEIWKRSTGGEKASWIKHAGFGHRASGFGYVGGATAGGVTFALRNFWEGAPRSIELSGLGGDTAGINLWAYSPEAPPLDMRHYDTVAHGLDLTYEDVGDPDPTPVGIGRSYEAIITLVPTTPSRDAIAELSRVHVNVPQVVSTPAFYRDMKVFGGRWDLPNLSTSGSKALEKRKDDLLTFYLNEIAQRQFYGFWNFGDVMHTYDSTRHTWRYDVGGFAWDNGELGTDLWLWMSFLRTGRADVFRTAFSLTRHLSEVDYCHTGPFAGLGTRHNVSHWGDGAKEARVAGSALKRPFYYLTADELVGDLMEFSLQADQTLKTWDPLRKVLPPIDFPARVRIGPDWTTLAGNWFTHWERTMDNQYRDKLVVGMKDIGAFKFGMFTGNGAAVGFDPDTGHLFDVGGEGEGSYHLSMIFGGGEFFMELVESIDVPEFDAVWIDFSRLYNGTDAERTAKYGKSLGGSSVFPFPQYYAKLQAYAGQRLNDETLKQAAWNVINTNKVGVWPPPVKFGGTDVVNPISEIKDLTTNDSAALSLNEYAVLAIAPELAPNVASDNASLSEVDTLAGEVQEEKKDMYRDARRGMVKPTRAVAILKRFFCSV